MKTSSTPPISSRPGISSSHTTSSVIDERTITAPAVPAMIARRCRCRGTLRAASAMTIALSPASTRSMTTIDASAQKNSMERISKPPLLRVPYPLRVLPGQPDLPNFSLIRFLSSSARSRSSFAF